MLKKLLLGAFVLLALLYAGFRWIGGAAGLVEASLPAFPDFPAPVALAADSAGEIFFETSTPYDFDVILRDMGSALPTTGRGTLFLPEGASAERPVPGMVLLHGSGGIKPGREMEYGQMLAADGYAAFVVDYYGPRGVTSETPYLLKVIAVTEFDVIADAYAALALLASHPAIDGGRIGVAGYSYGGMATRFAMDERIREVLAPDHSGFAAFVDFYGPCFQNLGTEKTNGSPLLTLRGTEDASNDLEACARREAELRALGVGVEAHVYEGAGHAWESTARRELHEDSPYIAGCEVVYDANGRSSVNGRGIVDVPPATPRAERVAIRMASGDAMAGCVRSGYVIGGDPPVKAKSDAALRGFLARTLGSPS